MSQYNLRETTFVSQSEFETAVHDLERVTDEEGVEWYYEGRWNDYRMVRTVLRGKYDPHKKSRGRYELYEYGYVEGTE